MENDNELYHHGVKGQKWGVRRKERKQALYNYNKKTTKDFAENRYKSTEKAHNARLEYAKNKLSQLTINRSDRARIQANIAKGKSKVAQYVKGYMRSGAKNTVANIAGTTAVTLGAGAIGILSGGMAPVMAFAGGVSSAISTGQQVKRIYNTVTNK